MDKFSGVTEFVATVEAKSFVSAAQRLGVTTSGVSKAVSRLEARLGVRLLNRTTRSLGLTEEGGEFYQRCRRVLAEFEDAQSAVSQASVRPQGRLRVDLPPALGRIVIVPVLGRLLELYPELTVQVALRNRLIDLVEEGVDAVVRVGSQPDSGLIVRVIGAAQLMTVAAPGYLERWGEPSAPEDLARHTCLNFLSPRTGRPREWRFARAGRALALAVPSRFEMGGSEALVDAASAGAGIVQVYDFAASRAVAAGLLVPILKKHAPAAEPVSVLYTQTKHVSPKIRAFADFMATLFRKFGR